MLWVFDYVKDPILANSSQNWRKRWDSNPRIGFPIAGFQDQFLKPLGHSSASLATEYANIVAALPH
jgi:hypothetical protein